jgi:hypothetical protein
MSSKHVGEELDEELDIPSYDDRRELYESIAEELGQSNYDNLDEKRQNQVKDVVAKETIFGEPGSLEDLNVLHAHSHDN